MTLPPPPPPPPPKPDFPRSAPDAPILHSPDYANYAARKTAFEADREYDARYLLGDDPTIRQDLHLGMMNAAAAYARGASGAGETVVVMDTGLRETHQEFTFHDRAVTLEITPGYTPDDEEKGHGTSVASLAVGGRNDGGFVHGVAYQANLHVFPISERLLGNEYQLFDLTEYADSGYASVLSRPIIDGKGTIINFSFGLNSGGVTAYEESVVRTQLQRTAAALAQKDTPAADRKIIVWAASNDGGEQYPDGSAVPFDAPHLWAGLGVYFPELRDHVIAVVALKQDGAIASYSNRCGVAKVFCIAAPGSEIISADSMTDDRYTVGDGTSFAAPLVAGSLALLRHYFRNTDGTYQLGNSELVARLLATANRRGRYTNSDIYGHGLVDLDAATAPVGTMRSSLPQDPLALPLVEAWVELYGGAFGPRLERALAAIPLTAFDELGAPFPYTVTGQLQRPRPSAELPRALRLRQAVAQSKTGLITRLEMVGDKPGSDGEELLLSVATPSGVSFLEDHHDGRGWWFSWGRHAGLSLGLYRDNHNAAAQGFLHRAAFAAPWLSLVQQGPSFGVSLPLPSGGRMAFALLRGAPRQDGTVDATTEVANGAGLVLDYQPGTSSLSLQAGFVQEEESFLGARPHGVFGSASGNTLFTGFNRRWSLGEHWQALASAHLGITQAQFSAAGLLHDAEPLYSSAFSVAVERSSWWQKGDWAGLRISQPLRVESGSAALRVAHGRTRYGEVLYEQRNISLRPSGRTLQAEAAWRGHFAAGELFLSLGLEHHAEQDTHQALQFQGALQYRRSF